MKNQIALYVPSTVNVDRPVDSSKYVELIAKLFSVWFGGASVQNLDGFYMSDHNGLVGEKVYKVYSFVEEIDQHTKDRVNAAANLIKSRMSQEYVTIEFLTYANEGMLFV